MSEYMIGAENKLLVRSSWCTQCKKGKDAEKRSDDFEKLIRVLSK